MNVTTRSGLTRRYPDTNPDGYGVHVTPTGCVTRWPPGIGRYYRPVVLTTTHHRVGATRYGHRRADGSHMNVPVNRVCLDCVVEAELEYLRATWRATYTGKRRPR